MKTEPPASVISSFYPKTTNKLSLFTKDLLIKLWIALLSQSKDITKAALIQVIPVARGNPSWKQMKPWL